MELDIILKAKNGDEKALDLILNRYKPLVLSLSRKYFLIGGTIEDLVQEGNIGLFKAITSYDISKNISFVNFCKLCIERNLQTAISKANNTKNKVLNYFDSIDGEDEEELSFPDSTPSPEEMLISNEILQELKENIRLKLTTLEKQVLYHFIKGKSYNEISDILQVSTKSVDNALNRLRKKLSNFKPN
ncbi:MAG: sigma-70 family RNA polymerase sigma factor [Clostridia bacterium]|nr:sigma-70 family RNA polymerase sigma factor [Clostridia bacterium]